MKNGLRMNALAALCLSLLLTGARPPEAPVADAAQRGDAEAVRELLRQGADVNAPQGDGMTALHWVAEAGDLELAAMLLYAGASLEARTRNGNYAPLHLASRAARGDMVAKLLEAGADAGATTSLGSTALHFAAGAASTAAVAVLLEHGAEIDSRETSYEQTPLMWAAAYGHTEVVKQLLAAGADLRLFSRAEDISALSDQRAVEMRRRNARVDAMVELQKAEREGRDAELSDVGVTRTIDELEAGSEEEEEEKAEPLTYDDLVGRKGGLTPLHFAAREGQSETVRVLLEAGSDINRVTEGDHSTPMLLAAINGHFDLAVELLARGGDPNIASDAGATALHAALNLQWHPKSIYPQPQAFKQQQNSYLDLMRAMLEGGADPDMRLEKTLWYTEYNFPRLAVEFAGSTAFWRAAYAQDVAAMRLLVEYGADPNIPTKLMPDLQSFRGYEIEEEDQSGLDPVPLYGPASYAIHAATGIGFGAGYAGGFHRGAPNGWLPSVKYLVEELGADVNARDEKGFSPLHHAASRGDVPVIEFLLEHGADPHVVSRAGQTTADMANSPVQRVPVYEEALRLLEGLGVKNNNNCQVC